ncbi:exodeoxyribonuclease V subunit gamma [Candidatus Thiosymbion oneisti]|uniref:exodeoxyribonuclease V subunit gamma n=1 Tax=Candidatus Thiosymbion oneisti TaxID=589554 RepID=UPI000A8C5E88|nr:exodeoxyribonuclease V subunit gamma [Candidatus Thiosymbion oneisti]
MLQIYHSNRLEALVEELARITAAPLADPFQSETIVVQNQGMARWIAQQLAQHNGISAQLDFPLPARFLWRVLQVWLPDAPDATRFDKGALLWRVYKQLPDLLDRSAFAPLARYLADDTSGLKLYQLARRIADLFDQYLVFRPDLVLGWEQGTDRHWQAVLWRALGADGDQVHRAQLLAELESAMTRGEPDTGALPKRVCLFGLSALAPVHVRMLGALASWIPVHLFFLNPCREYWSDLVDERGQARRRARAQRAGQPDPTGLLDLGNPLLASLGHAGQIFLDQLLELGGLDHDCFVSPRGDSLLRRVQRDLLELIDPQGLEPQVIARDERSIQLHSTHGPLREIQVLHDRLLHLFEVIDGLEPRDIIVMAPDIDRYAPYVEAVFGAADGPMRIPWSIADRRIAGERPVLEALRFLLTLPSSRFEAGELLSLLEVPALRRRFDLDQQGLERIRTWVQESGVRWGEDGAMRADLGLPDEPANTWAFGLRRLFLGYALPPDADDEPYAGVLPYPDLEGSEAADLGQLAALVETLGVWRRHLAVPRSLAGWRSAVNELLAACFAPDDEEEALLQLVRDGLDEAAILTATVGFDRPVGLDVLRALVRDLMDDNRGAHRFLTGRVNFCNMVPMRSIPFRVVCLIGMNGTDFPRTQRPLSFDLMARHPRRGDRSRRRDDRYLFLEALLSARDVFYLSWVGNDERDNSLKVSSVVIDELLDYLRRGYRLPDGADLVEQLVVRHPLQPFSRRYFNPGDERLFSYAQTWLEAARTQVEGEIPAFCDAELPEPGEAFRTLELEDLIRFLRNPARYFLTERLGLSLPEEAEALPDTEPFDAAGLERYRLDQALLHGLLEGREPSSILARLRGAGILPHGAPGELLFDELSDAAGPFIQRLQGCLVAAAEPIEVDLSLVGFRLQGQLGNLHATGLIDYRFGKLNAKDRLRAWVRHLVLNLLVPQGIEPTSTFVAKDRILRLMPVADAGALLADLLELRRQGLSRPLAFFPESGLAWLEHGYGSGFDHAWCGRYNPAPERDQAAVRIAFRGREPIGEEFEQTALRVLKPMLEWSETEA